MFTLGTFSTTNLITGLLQQIIWNYSPTLMEHTYYIVEESRKRGHKNDHK